MLKAYLRVVNELKAREEGATMVEYGLMVALVAVVAITAVTALGNGVVDTFDTITGELGGAG
jgi:pilus assembly protein Flp/PilA